MLPFHKTLIIIPTYNEAPNIERVIKRIHSLSSQINILVVDDNSPDQTADIVSDLSKQFTQIHLLSRSKKMGLGTAYICGLKYALENNYEYAFEMDADGSHDIEDIPRFLEVAPHMDLVIGSRYLGGIRIINWSLRRLLLSYFASWYTRFITGMPLYDGMSGFKCFNRHALESLPLNQITSNGYAFQIEVNYLLWNKGLKIKEIPIVFYERRIGRSKMNWGVIWEAVWRVPWLRVKKLLGPLKNFNNKSIN